MTWDLRDCTFSGPALPLPFVQFDLKAHVGQRSGAALETDWTTLRRRLRATSGAQSVYSHVIVPLAATLGFGRPQRQDLITTREGLEDGGWLMNTPSGALLRAWAIDPDAGLDVAQRSSRAYRFSPMRCAQRVLLSTGERIALLTDGEELRILLCDPIRPDSYIAIPLGGSSGWRAQAVAPDSYRLLLALATPAGIAALPQNLEAARLAQTRVTKDLRLQARAAIEGFLQGVLDHPANAAVPDLHAFADTLWAEALVLVYRLLFILKLESAADPARAFSFASTELWRGALSPNRALGPLVRRLLDQDHATGRMLEDGLRALFRAFRDGLSCSELTIAPLGGALLGAGTTPLLDRLAWGERAVALLLDRLLWTTPPGRERERVHYGALDVEELGRIYEGLLELEPGIAGEAVVRLRRGKLEVVQPEGQSVASGTARRVEDIPAGRFFLRVGLGRKTTGSFYTPHPFVRFLVREALAPQIARRSPDADPQPAAILALKVVDPATGSGHFLVEACRFLGEALYAACRLCDELAVAAEETALSAAQSEGDDLLARAAALRARVAALPEPDGMLLAYLPSRAIEGGNSGVSEARALAICRRLVAVNCLYGVDSNRLAVELARLSLWLESYAEGLPLTFLDHRVVHGDSIAGPFFADLCRLPVGRRDLDPLLARDVDQRLGATLDVALREVRGLQSTVGTDAADLMAKQAAKRRLDAVLRPLQLLARAWSGAVMLATREADDEWLALARRVAADGAWPEALTERQSAMLETAAMALPWDLVFPEVFWNAGRSREECGFDAVLGNPPWDMVQPNITEFFSKFDLSVLDAASKRESDALVERLLETDGTRQKWSDYRGGFIRLRRLAERLYRRQRLGAHDAVMGGKLDLYRIFAERFAQLAGSGGTIGFVVPSAFHANEGATGVRRFYLEQTRLEWCLSFENRRKLFDIHSRIKFALLVAHRPGPTVSTRCGFYLAEFGDMNDPARILPYDRAFIDASGGSHSTLLEVRDDVDLALTRQLFLARQRFRTWARCRGISLSRELHMTDDAARFIPARTVEKLEEGYLLLHEGKTIHQFTDRWDTPPRHAVALSQLRSKPRCLSAARFFRAACREIARSTDDRTAIAAMLSVGVTCGHTISVERRPEQRPNQIALTLVALLNSFTFDWILRQKAAAHVSLYILAELPVPALAPDAERFLAHASLRLCCNHAGYAPLWHEQLGDTWREASPPATWPAIASVDRRWELRAAMDAIVAHAYGLSRSQYQRILQSFSHRSYPLAAALCLAAFDALAEQGLQSFVRQHDPYDDIPPVTTLAQPAELGAAFA